MVRSNVLISRLKKGPGVYLSGGRVPPSLCTEAVSCAVYLINRLPVPGRHGEYSILSVVQCTRLRVFPESPSCFWMCRVCHITRNTTRWQIGHRQLLQAYMLDMAWIIRNITYTILHWGIYLCLSKSSSMSPFSHWQISVKLLILMNLPLPD